MAVADPFGAEVQSGQHGLRPLAVPGVTGEGNAQLPRQVEHRRKAGKRRQPLRPRKVDPHHALRESPGSLPDRL